MWFVFNFGHFGCGKKDKLITTFKLAFGNNKIDRLPQRSKRIWFIECKFLVRPFSRLLVGNASLHRRTDLSQVTSTPADADHHWYHHLQCLFHLCPGVPSIVHFGTHISRIWKHMSKNFSRFRWVEYEPFNNPNTKLSTKIFLPITCAVERRGPRFPSSLLRLPADRQRAIDGHPVTAWLLLFTAFHFIRSHVS